MTVDFDVAVAEMRKAADHATVITAQKFVEMAEETAALLPPEDRVGGQRVVATLRELLGAVRRDFGGGGQS